MMAPDDSGAGEPDDAGRLPRTGPAGAVERLWDGEIGGIRKHLLGALLTPAELGFRAAIQARNAAYRSGIADTDAPPVPAISVGNITVGGTGKTPMVRWLVHELLRRGYTPGILHGGYAEDEPELHRRWFPALPVVAEKDRRVGADVAMQQGADVLVLDDAFQHRRFGRDLDLVLVAAETWTPDARLLPRGPYRESPAALRRADLVVVTRRTASEDEAAGAQAEVGRLAGTPTARALLGPGAWLTGKLRARKGAPTGPAVALAGIGRPDDFFDQVEALGVDLREAVAFSDHHDYGWAEADEIRRTAGDGPVITTAKDAVKLAPLLPELDLWVLDLEVRFESGRDAVLGALGGILS